LHKPRPNPTILIVFGLWILWGFGYETLYPRLVTDIEGTVVSVKDIPYAPAPARYGTEYIFRNSGGRTSQYTAGPTDASLSRSMPVGTYIRKQRWHFSYERNGQQVDDFGLYFYVALLAIAVGSLVWGARLKSNQAT